MEFVIVYPIAFVWIVCCLVNLALLKKHALPEAWEIRKARMMLSFLILAGPVGLIAIIILLYCANIICRNDWDDFE